MYNYFIFISYSRKDSKIAAYLQRQLENFRIPVKLSIPKENLPDGQEFIRPVFRDRRDLKSTEQSFTKDIQEALEHSRYLLVLCSPNSVESQWVKEEIDYFLKSHGHDYTKVVPVLWSGSQSSTNSMEDCLPVNLRLKQIMLRNLPSMKSDDGETKEEGWENGLVQIISYILKVDHEAIKKIIDRGKIRKMQKNIGIVAILSIIFLMLAIWANHAEYVARKNLILAQKQEKRARDEEKLAKENEKRAIEAEIVAKKNESLARENEKRAIEAEIVAKKNESLAKEQMEIKNKAFEFLQEILMSANPNKNGLQKITLSDALKMKKQDVKVIENWQLRALLSLQIGKLFDDHGEYGDAYELVSIAVALYTKNMPWTNEAGDACNVMGLIQLHQNKYEEALKFFNQAIAHYSRNNDESIIIARIYRNIAVAYINLKQFDQAMQYSQKSLELCIKLKNDLDIARAYNNLGLIYYSRRGEGDDEKCLECHQKSLEIKLNCLSDKEDVEIAACYYNVCLAYLRMNEREKAYDNLQKAYNIVIKLFDESHPLCKQYKHLLDNSFGN